MGISVVKVAVEQTAYHFDKLYTYQVPKGVPCPSVGCRVVVPFGGSNTRRNAFVVALSETIDIEKIKPIVSVVDKVPLLSEELVQLALWMKEQTFCCLYDALKTMLPAGLQMNMSRRYQAGDLTKDISSLDENVQQLITALRKSSQVISKEKLIEVYGLDEEGEILDRLVKQGFLKKDDTAVRRMGDATVKTVELTPQGLDETMVATMTPKQRLVQELLAQVGAATVKEVCYFTGVTPAVITTLHKKGLVHLYEQEVYRTPTQETVSSDCREIHLSDTQRKAYERLKELLLQEKGAAALLYGITGSGKTSVYLKLIDCALSKRPDGGIIVMVPEISLTPQAMAIFKSRYGNKVAIFHSRLSLGERLDEWKRVKKGLAQIVVGTRSAVFAPFEKISLIVMDEEQEHTYKSEASPRFHARDVARFRAAFQGALLVLASATPSLESFAKAKAGTYTLCRMDERYGVATLPQVQVVDMRDERLDGNLSVYGEPLLAMLEQVLSEKKQAILLLNRRGYHTFVSCGACGYVHECPECSISMTYHRANNRMMCHYCGGSAPLPEKCPSCGGDMMKMSGVGTQKAEEMLAKLLPDAKILRMDADSTMSRTAHSEKLSAFAKGEYDILLGTQMVAKGLDFPNVSLVGVLNADQMLHNNDYRAYERGFSLLTQVIGRAGRADSQGFAVIQTAEPDHELIDLAKEQDYDAFFAQEMQLRKMMEYPPYCDICLLGFVGINREKTEMASRAMLDLIKKSVAETYTDLPLKILGPSPSQVVKVGGKYRYRLIIKCKNTKAFRKMLGEALTAFGHLKGFGGVTAFADMNPEGFL